MTILCSKCGSSNDDEDIYCGSCGALLGPRHTSSPLPDQTPQLMKSLPPAPSPRYLNRTRNIVIGFVAVIIVVVVAIALISTKGAGPIAGQSHTLNIVSGSLTVDKSGYVIYQFTVPAGATNSQIKGSFTVTAQGGSGIQVYVLDDVNLFIWGASHGNATVSDYYKSGQVTSGIINIRLSPGTYYLIFDNTFSGLNTKDVQANVSLAHNS
jgi:hypothetical protein